MANCQIRDRFRRMLRYADGLRRLSEGSHLVATQMAGAAIQYHAVADDAARRTFRRV
jgi:hypothetical protein